MPKDNIMKEYLYFILIAAGFLYMGSLFGSGLFISLALPILIALFSYRNAMRRSVVFVVMTAIVALAFSSSTWLFILTLYGVMGVLTGQYIKRAMPHEKAVMKIFVSAMVGVAVLLFALQGLAADLNIAEVVREQVEAVQLPAQMLDQFKASNPEIASEIGDLENAFKEMMLQMMPIIIATAVFLNSLLVYLFTIYILHARRYKTLPLVKLSRIRLPGNPMLGTTLIIVMALLSSWLVPRWGDVVVVNAIYLVVLIFAVQGVAVVAFFLTRTKLNRLVKVVLFIALTVLLQVFGLAIAGWLDAGFKIRYKVSGKDLK